jgi:subtilisin family serine protease
VVAAGNSNDNACFQVLASSPKAIAVGATTDTDARAWFSNYGSCVDIFAPGVNITSSIVTGPSNYGAYNGTSMAAPHVAGAAVLYFSKKQSATAQEVTDHLLTNATQGIVTSSSSPSNHLLYTGKSQKEK